MFKTLIILYARSFWVTASRPNPGRSFQHWPQSMISPDLRADLANILTIPLKNPEEVKVMMIILGIEREGTKLFKLVDEQVEFQITSLEEEESYPPKTANCHGVDGLTDSTELEPGEAEGRYCTGSWKRLC
jgi:hypothetical protein